MPARNTGRHHASALLPAALLSVALSAPWGGAAAPTAEPAAAPTDDTAPTTVPTDAIEAPASLARRGPAVARERRLLDAEVAQATAAGIPTSALSAYQRAQTVINTADKTCNLDWQLVAAIGRVESDHGRYGGNTLDAKGVSRPGIFGIPLDGSNDTAVIRDTDAGQYDNDQKWDRAVGPMQFIPSTWSVVGVDGDNDGQRNPQDIDDAALATAVYLCSGNDDVSTERGQRAAIFRYNHSHHYVDLVLGFMNAYLDGDFTSVPSSSSGLASYTGTFDRPASIATESPRPRDQQGPRRRSGADHVSEIVTPGGKDDLDSEIVTPSAPGTKPDDGSDGEDDGTDTGNGDTGEETEQPTDPGAEEPAPEEPTEEPAPEEPSEEPAPEEPSETPDEPDITPIPEDEAIAECLEEVGATAEQLPDLEALGLLVDFDTCMTELGFPQ